MSRIIEYGDDKVLGKVEDIEVHFKARCMELVNSLGLFNDGDDYDSIELIKSNLDDILELLNGMYQDVITGDLKDDDIIEVAYHPMGAYQYKIYKEQN